MRFTLFKVKLPRFITLPFGYLKYPLNQTLAYSIGPRLSKTAQTRSAD